MTKQLVILLLFTFRFATLSAQDLVAQLKANAIAIEQPDRLSQPIYDKLKDFKLIMLGEMHGTNEPVSFLTGLTELFSDQGDTVQVGFEIPSDQMKNYLHSLTDSSVILSDFFSSNSEDGRGSIAWANAIIRLTKKSNVTIFFYDSDMEENNTFENRDSLMYVKIKQRMTEHPNWRTVTLSGNIHNMRLPFKEQLTAGYYLCNDKELDLSGRMCTLNHYYQRGTMLNNIGNGLELSHINNNPSVFSESLSFDNYLFLFQEANAYNGIFFTKTVTASY